MSLVRGLWAIHTGLVDAPPSHKRAEAYGPFTGAIHTGLVDAPPSHKRADAAAYRRSCTGGSEAAPPTAYCFFLPSSVAFFPSGTTE